MDVTPISNSGIEAYSDSGLSFNSRYDIPLRLPLPKSFFEVLSLDHMGRVKSRLALIVFEPTGLNRLVLHGQQPKLLDSVIQRCDRPRIFTMHVWSSGMFEHIHLQLSCS